MKQTTLGQAEEIWDCAWYFLKSSALNCPMRRGLKQSPGVGMERVLKDLPDGSLFHDLSCVHDDQPLGSL